MASNFPGAAAIVTALACAAASCSRSSPAQPTDAGPGPVVAAIDCIRPARVPSGSDGFEMGVFGARFGPASVVRLEGRDLATRFVSSGELWASLDAGDLASARDAQITVLAEPGSPASAAATFSVATVRARRRVPSPGLYLFVERRGYPVEYWMGQLLHDWTTFDSVVGSTPAQEAALQLDRIRALGVDHFTYELRSSDATDGPNTPPACTVNPALGLQYPNPTAAELTNLRSFLDLSAGKGFKVWLRLVNLHMEESPPVGNAAWLDAILGAIKDHPAVDLVLFEGDVHAHPESSPPSCGIQAEPPLFLGPDALPAQYLQWAMGRALSQGWPARRLGAESIVGAYILDAQIPAGPNATDHHLWPAVAVMKKIFDRLAVPAAERTYALSMYEANKCRSAGATSCADEPPHAWAEETLQSIWRTVGWCSGARVVAPETGDLPPVAQGWGSPRGLESLTSLWERYGVEGGAYWRWVQTENSTDTDATQGQAVKLRGTAFRYTPVAKEVIDQAGTHLGAVPNGSFERGGVAAELWSGGGARIDLGTDAVPTRGTHALRLDPGTSALASATSASIPIAPSTAYVLTGNFRFAFSGDPSPAAAPEQRPQVRVTISSWTTSGAPASGTPAVFRFFQEDSTSGFATFPLSFTTPADADTVRIELAVVRNGLPGALVADFDALR
jgi:hypothetical protein